MKICSRCQKQLPLESFTKDKYASDGLDRWCRACKKEYRAQYYIDNRNKELQQAKQYNEEHAEEKRAYEKQYRIDNRDKINETHIKQHHRYMSTNTEYKIRRNLRNRIRKLLNGSRINSSILETLGCSVVELKLYLESKFHINPDTGEAMSWNNWGPKGWHIDHIVPLSAFVLTDTEQFKTATHYTNLQPLWAKANLVKGAKIL